MCISDNGLLLQVSVLPLAQAPNPLSVVPYYPIGTLKIKSSKGRSARFRSTRSGGEEEFIRMMDSGMEATQLPRHQRCRLAPG